MPGRHGTLVQARITADLEEATPAIAYSRKPRRSEGLSGAADRVAVELSRLAGHVTTMTSVADGLPPKGCAAVDGDRGQGCVSRKRGL